MNEKDILRAIGDVKDEYIEEADRPVSAKVTPFRKIVKMTPLIAAAAVIVLSVGIFKFYLKSSLKGDSAATAPAASESAMTDSAPEANYAADVSEETTKKAEEAATSEAAVASEEALEESADSYDEAAPKSESEATLGPQKIQSDMSEAVESAAGAIGSQSEENAPSEKNRTQREVPGTTYGTTAGGAAYELSVTKATHGEEDTKTDEGSGNIINIGDIKVSVTKKNDLITDALWQSGDLEFRLHSDEGISENDLKEVVEGNGR